MQRLIVEHDLFQNLDDPNQGINDLLSQNKKMTGAKLLGTNTSLATRKIVSSATGKLPPAAKQVEKDHRQKLQERVYS